METLVMELAVKFPMVGLVLSGLGALMVVAQVVVVVTPSKKDDEILDEAAKLPIVGGLLTLIKKFAPIQKK